MSYDRLAGRLFNVPLLVTPEKAEIIASVFNAYIEGRSSDLPKVEPEQRIEMATSLSLRRTDGGYYMSNAGVAVVQVHGSLVQRAGSMEAMSGMAGYNRIGGMLAAATRDPSVRGIVLEIDSPGGEVSGLLELATMVADSEKPVYAHANELAASAAYWLGSSATKLYAPTTGLLGSIGVVMLHVDRSKQIERAGLTYTPIFAGARKLEGSSLAPLTEEARSNAQARVDEIYSLFVDHVASARGMDAQDVRDTEAGVFSVQEAESLGLADGVATLGEVIQMMTDDLNAGRLGNRTSFGRAAVNAQQPKELSTMADDKSKAAPNVNAETQALIDAARAEGVASGEAKAATAAKAAADATASEANKAATERIKAIQTCDAAKTRPALAAHLAFETSMPAADAAAMLAKAGEETKGAANPLAGVMPPNPRVGADKEPADGAGKVRINTAEIYDMRAKARS